MLFYRVNNFVVVTPAGIEPASSESESEILSIVLRSQNFLQISSTGSSFEILFSFNCRISCFKFLFIN